VSSLLSRNVQHYFIRVLQNQGLARGKMKVDTLVQFGQAFFAKYRKRFLRRLLHRSTGQQHKKVFRLIFPCPKCPRIGYF
jgi:hypothetical protein